MTMNLTFSNLRELTLRVSFVCIFGLCAGSAAVAEDADLDADLVSAAEATNYEHAAGCTCSSGPSWYAESELMLAWRHGRRLPPLVTTSPTTTPPFSAGVLPAASVLFGGSTVGEDVRPAGRVTLGKWLDESQTNSVEGRFWMLGEYGINFATNSTASPVLARPFYDVATLSNNAVLLAYPGFTGPSSVSVSSHSEVLSGEFLYRHLALESDDSRLDFLAGYHFSRIDEDLNINSLTTVIGVPGVTSGTTLTDAESFEARNEFHGGQIGMSANYFIDCNWQVDMLAKVAIGNMRQTATIAGRTTIVTPGPGSTTSVQPGLLAGAANSGQFTRNRFAIIPEVGAKLRRSFTDCLDVSVGYSFIYWSSVIQPGDQIDPRLRDPAPAYRFRPDSYWVHALNFGGTLRF